MRHASTFSATVASMHALSQTFEAKSVRREGGNVNRVEEERRRAYLRALGMHDVEEELTSLNWQRLFEPWVTTGITAQMQSAAWQMFTSHATLFRISNGQLYVEERPSGQSAMFTAVYISTLLRLLRKHDVPDVEFVLNLNDEPVSEWRKEQHEAKTDPPPPVLSWGRDRTRHPDILVPNPDFLRDLYCEDTRNLDINGTSWEERRPILFWRGTNTGPLHTEAGWYKLPRPRLLLECSSHLHLCDAGFVALWDNFENDNAKNALLHQLPLRQSVPRDEYSNAFRYIASVDGNGVTGRVAGILWSSSLLMKQESAHEEYFYHALVPGKHYLPLAPDLSDVASQVRYAQNNDEVARHIARCAYRFAKRHLNFANVEQYLLNILRRLAAYQRFDVVIPPTAKHVDPNWRWDEMCLTKKRG